MKRLFIISAAIVALAFAGVAAAATSAKLVGSDKVTEIGGLPVDEHFVYQNIVDGNPNGLENELDELCDGDSGSISIQIGNGSPTQYDVVCAHFVLTDGGTHNTMNFAFKSGETQWTLIRWLGTKNKMFIIDSLACVASAVNKGPGSSGAVCNGHITSVGYRSSGPGAHMVVS